MSKHTACPCFQGSRDIGQHLQGHALSSGPWQWQCQCPPGSWAQCPGPLAVAEVGHVHSQGGGNEQCSVVGLSTAATPEVTGAAGGAQSGDPQWLWPVSTSGAQDGYRRYTEKEVSMVVQQLLTMAPRFSGWSSPLPTLHSFSCGAPLPGPLRLVPCSQP